MNAFFRCSFPMQDTGSPSRPPHVELARMRPGQTATVAIDRYPGERFSALQLAQVDSGLLLRAGLSANVTIDTRSAGARLAAATKPPSAGMVSR
jgi:hypothetical protein